MKSGKWALILISLFLFPVICYSSELVFQFTNPSFGGNPLYGTFLLEQAKMQNKFEKKYGYKRPSLLERFENVLASQILYNLAHRIVDLAFGGTQEGSQIQPGTYLIGNYEITISYVSNGIQLIVTDLGTGETTQLTIPQFTNP